MLRSWCRKMRKTASMAGGREDEEKRGRGSRLGRGAEAELFMSRKFDSCLLGVPVQWKCMV